MKRLLVVVYALCILGAVVALYSDIVAHPPEMTAEPSEYGN
jgi:hypothetical protein